MNATPLRPELLRDIAAQFEAMEQPCNMTWMQKRAVTLDELHAVSALCAVILRGYLALPPQDQIAFATDGAYSRATKAPPPSQTVLGRRHADQPNGHAAS